MKTYNNLEELKNELKEIEKKLNDISKDFIGDWSIDNAQFLCDAITEYADSHTSIYFSDQKEFYNNNVELCEAALIEFGYNLNDLLKEGNSLTDIICRAGAVGEYSKNQKELYEDEEEIKKALLLKYCIDNNILINLEDIDYILNIFEIDRLNDILDCLNDYLEE